MGLLLWPFHFCLLFHEASYLQEVIVALISEVTARTLSPFLVMWSVSPQTQLTQTCSNSGDKPPNYHSFLYLFEHRKRIRANGQI